MLSACVLVVLGVTASDNLVEGLIFADILDIEYIRLVRVQLLAIDACVPLLLEISFFLELDCDSFRNDLHI